MSAVVSKKPQYVPIVFSSQIDPEVVVQRQRGYRLVFETVREADHPLTMTELRAQLYKQHPELPTGDWVHAAVWTLTSGNINLRFTPDWRITII